jgi:hypothetical protein
MRALVVLLALLAGAKIYAQDWLYREGAQDALIQAYREQAMAACQSQLGPHAGAPLWTRPASVELVIGRASVNVRIWQLNSALWPARFKHPHVVLTAIDGAEPSMCEYDVIEGRAYVTPMT